MAQLSQVEIFQAELDAALKQIVAEQEAWAAQAQSQQREKTAAMKSAAEKKLRTVILIGQYLENSMTSNKVYATTKSRGLSVLFQSTRESEFPFRKRHAVRGQAPRHPINGETGYERK